VADRLLLARLLGSEDDLGRVDDDHVVARVDVGCVGRLVLAAQQGGHLRGQPAQDEAVGVNEVPGALDVGGLR
jgi:hypothetical protein